MKSYIEELNESYARVYAEKQNTLVNEHHGDDFSDEILNMSVNDLLDKLAQWPQYEKLYKTLEYWLKYLELYEADEEKRGPVKPGELVDLTFNKDRR